MHLALFWSISTSFNRGSATEGLPSREAPILSAVFHGAMILVIDASGKYWDGFGWSQQGKTFLTVAAATRSLCEEGEDTEQVQFVEKQQ